MKEGSFTKVIAPTVGEVSLSRVVLLFTCNPQDFEFMVGSKCPKGDCINEYCDLDLLSALFPKFGKCCLLQKMLSFHCSAH